MEAEDAKDKILGEEWLSGLVPEQLVQGFEYLDIK